jgi:hypothetical protein
VSDRIRTYIERSPEAISGQGGHNTTLRVARALYNGFALSHDQVLEWLQVYNSRLSDRWTARELEHKADSAASGIYDKPRGWMLGRHEAKPRRIVIQPPKISNNGWKPTKRYVLATDATDVFYSQATVCARACAQSHGESEVSVALVADARKGPKAAPLALDTPRPKRTAIEGPRIVSELRRRPQDGPKQPSSRWDAAILTGSAQPRTRAESDAFLAAAFEPGDTYDFSNSEDVAEWNKLHPKTPMKWLIKKDL